MKYLRLMKHRGDVEKIPLPYEESLDDVLKMALEINLGGFYHYSSMEATGLLDMSPEDRDDAYNEMIRRAEKAFAESPDGFITELKVYCDADSEFHPGKMSRTEFTHEILHDYRSACIEDEEDEEEAPRMTYYEEEE